MDTPEELYYQELEEQYLNDNARFKVNDSVIFEDTNHKLNIGIVKGIIVTNKLVERNGKGYNLTVIMYRVLTVKGLVYFSDAELTSASEWILREYWNSEKAN